MTRIGVTDGRKTRGPLISFKLEDYFSPDVSDDDSEGGDEISDELQAYLNDTRRWTTKTENAMFLGYVSGTQRAVMSCTNWQKTCGPPTLNTVGLCGRRQRGLQSCVSAAWPFAPLVNTLLRPPFCTWFANRSGRLRVVNLPTKFGLSITCCTWVQIRMPCRRGVTQSLWRSPVLDMLTCSSTSANAPGEGISLLI